MLENAVSMYYYLKSSHVWYVLLLLWKHCGRLVVLNCNGLGIGPKVKHEVPPHPLPALLLPCYILGLCIRFHLKKGLQVPSSYHSL